MTYVLFRLPEHWVGWLDAAIRAEKICLDSGMSYSEAKEYLGKQPEWRVVEFANNFMHQSKTTVDNYQYSGGGRYHEGCRVRTVGGRKE